MAIRRSRWSLRRTLLGVTTDSDWTRWETALNEHQQRRNLRVALIGLALGLTFAVGGWGYAATHDGDTKGESGQIDCSQYAGMSAAEKPAACFR